MIRRVLFSCLLLLSVGCAEKAPRTQVMLVLDADPGVRAEASTLHVHVFGGERGQPASTFASRYVRMFSPPSFPFQVAMVPLEPEPARAWIATVETWRADDTPITRTTVRGGYAVGRTVRLDVRIEDACAGVLDCDEQRCVAGECVDALVDVAAQPDLVPDGGAP